ncbi:hypothetical protein EG329_002835 [Mollisiaceae sp. DMI_Dod_QoI]|nr:hypothetical protein EG329_002835 [Helotiales sp. DMI_Dod_QoI]
MALNAPATVLSCIKLSSNDNPPLASPTAAVDKTYETENSFTEVQSTGDPEDASDSASGLAKYMKALAAERRILFTDLPTDIHFKIFDLLCPVNSTCLGLTCKQFYEIHRKFHRKVSLMLRSSSSGQALDGRRLGDRIKEFFDPCLHFNTDHMFQYVTQETEQELRMMRSCIMADLNTKRMSFFQRANYLWSFQSDESDDEV